MTRRPHTQLHQRTNLRVAEQLIAENRISPENYQAALTYLKRYGGRVEEALLEVNALSEAALLSYLAGYYKTNFVSTERLAKVEIDRLVREKIPRKVAEKWQIVPVRFDGTSGVLSIVTADPHNVEMLDEVRIASGAKEVRAYLVRPAAAEAAVSKFYQGDAHAFTNLGKSVQQFGMLDVFERGSITEASVAIAATRVGAMERTMSPGDFALPRETPRETPREASQPRVSVTPVPPAPVAAPAPLPPPPAPSVGVAPQDYAETLNVLVSIIESGRAELRGHSSQVARLTRKLGERIGLEPKELDAVLVAAYLHDLGKIGSYHLTALNVAQYEGHRLAAEKTWMLPSRLMESVKLSPTTVQALVAMYERYDGLGLPGQRAGQEIPLGARVLAIVDSFADLTQNPRNPARRVLPPHEACALLEKFKGSIFDPNLLDLFRATVSGGDLRARLLHNRSRVLVVDADPEETTVLELRLNEQGFEVKIARTSDQALAMLEAGEIEIVISELDIGPRDGFSLLEEARKQSWGRDLPWLILTRRQGRTDAQRAFGLGVVDYVIKPAVTEVLIPKLTQAVERRATQGVARGVSGSLAEMALPDLVQILWHGKKNGLLQLRRGSETGEIHFADGRVVHATWGQLQGEDAFYGLLALTDGEFALDPNFRPPSVSITASPEALLLEGMRRLDEMHR